MTGDAVVVVDADDAIVRCSEHAARILGFDATSALGRRAAEVLPLPSRAADGPSVFARLAGGERWAAAPDAATAGAKLAWSARPMCDADGTFRGALYQARVVHGESDAARRASSVARAVGCELAAQAFEGAMEQMALLDRQRRILAMNEAFRTAAARAVPRPIELGNDLLAHAAPSTEAGFLDGFARALGGEHVKKTRSLTFPNGETFDLLVEYKPLVEDGAVTSVLFGSVLTENPVLRDFDLIGRALAVAPFVVVVADARKPDLPIVFVNEAVERLTGFARAEVLGRNARIFQGRFREQPALAVVRAALANREACEVVLCNEKKDGTAYFNRLSLTPVRDEHGTVSHYIGIQEDVTEREGLLARIRAAQASETSQQMLGGAVHDLRNMLTVISAQVGLAREDTADGSDGAVALDAASEAVRQAAALTRVLLAPVTRTRAIDGNVDLCALVRAVVSVCRYIVPRGVSVELDVSAAKNATVTGDRGALEQVLLNLVLNASEAMPTGGRVELRVDEGTPDEIVTTRGSARKPWTISVTDTGVGMSEDVLARLFEPYFTTKDEGSGLGLATCAQLVRAVGGDIRALSEPGRGTTFRVLLPPGTAKEPAPLRSSSLGSLEGVDALVVEPDTGLRAAICATLRRRGARVRDAGDLVVASGTRPFWGPRTLLVLDAERLDGTAAFVRAWLEESERRGLVIGNLDDEALPEAGPRVARLGKPFDFDALLVAIGELAADAGSQGPLPER